MIVRHAVILPKLGNSAKHAILATWYREAGDWICRGDILCTVKTRKAAYDVEADE